MDKKNLGGKLNRALVTEEKNCGYLFRAPFSSLVPKAACRLVRLGLLAEYVSHSVMFLSQ